MLYNIINHQFCCVVYTWIYLEETHTHRKCCALCISPITWTIKKRSRYIMRLLWYIARLVSPYNAHAVPVPPPPTHLLPTPYTASAFHQHLRATNGPNNVYFREMPRARPPDSDPRHKKRPRSLGQKDKVPRRGGQAGGRVRLDGTRSSIRCYGRGGAGRGAN